ncbi:Molybdopterin oxidoreductase subunit, predicted, chaperone protein HtpG [Rubellimicrobium mesophilum DSM 19309]|uniref:Molybdopterin oxidoreductase subunit, predicted, chaperone protein HtpG n=1 Tax=Rubellimicrobium mesophilum DSM 19309 TaxID=442562 RepID=A0A017HJI5_9RHOB|nr:cytochrome c3 family protein [Rubellimicrobium mesophilum]EYD73944.1 Molybdopterin oxidoreductase subunit, predicted, chaperone protein HtpG [Rubellimicrobium mesophilum DSM 19309]
MTQVFRPSANGIARLVLWSLGVGLLVLVAVSVIYVRSGWATGAERAPAQPVPFSHAHHVGGLGLDCRYCHTGVEVSASAGLPPTETCMTCHSQLYTNADMLAPVRESLATGQPIAWVRVHDLADFVYFNHSIHVAKGVACETCHGEVDAMPILRQEAPLTMGWCLSCHRDPQPNLRPPQDVFLMHWRPPADLARLQSWLMEAGGIHPEDMTDCYVCHR